LPHIWVRQEFQPDLSDAFLEMRAKGTPITIKGTPGCQIVPELPIGPSEIVIVKKRYSAFFGTDLDQTLRELKPDAIILAGINTHAFPARQVNLGAWPACCPFGVLETGPESPPKRGA
jgi:maleamate amidohydrolase